MKKICKLYNLSVLRFLVFSVIFSFAPQVFSESASVKPKRGSGVACLKANEKVVRACKTSVRSTALKNDKRCAKAKQIESVICNSQRLRCNQYDTNVCGITNPCTTNICRAVLSKYLTFDNICALKKASAQFEKRGKCDEAEIVEEPTCNDKSRAVCGLPLPICTTGLNSVCTSVAPQWYKNSCELLKAGAKQVADESCSACSSESDNNPICGKIPVNCTDLKNCPAIDSLPSWYKNRCELLNNNAQEVLPTQCSVEDCPVQESLCGVAKYRCQGNNVSTCEIKAKASPQLFRNRCELLASNAVEVDKASCLSILCSSDINKRVCGVIEPPPCVASGAKTDICQARPTIVKWFESECALLKAGARLVANEQCGL